MHTSLEARQPRKEIKTSSNSNPYHASSRVGKPNHHLPGGPSKNSYLELEIKTSQKTKSHHKVSIVADKKAYTTKITHLSLA